MKSSTNVIKSSMARVDVEAWLPFEVDGTLSAEMPTRQGSRTRLIDSSQPKLQVVHPGSGRAALKNGGAALNSWVPPEIDLTSEIFSMALEKKPEIAASMDMHANATVSVQQKIDMLVQARGVIVEAEAQAAKIIRDAEAKTSQIRADAYQHGILAAEAESERLLRAARTIADEVYAWRESMIAQSEKTVINLVTDIAKSIFGSGLKLNDEALNDVYRRILAEAKNLGALLIRVHPDDAELINAKWLQDQAGFHQEVKLVADPSIARGGCLVDGEYGQIDATVETQLEITVDTINTVLAARYADQNAQMGESSEAFSV